MFGFGHPGPGTSCRVLSACMILVLGLCLFVMTSYLYELPTTGAISFAEFCTDATATYTADIADATEARANLRSALKESKRTDRGEKDDLKLVKVSLNSHGGNGEQA